MDSTTTACVKLQLACQYFRNHKFTKDRNHQVVSAYMEHGHVETPVQTAIGVISSGSSATLRKCKTNADMQQMPS